MSDFDRFSTYWNETADAMFYRIHTSKGPMLTETELNAMWRQEIDKRFFSQGLVHEATVFLEELSQKAPALCDSLTDKLRHMHFELGAKGDELIKNGAMMAGAGAGLVASLTGKNAVLRLLFAGASAVLLGQGIRGMAGEVADATPASLAEKVKELAEASLQEFRLLFDAESA